ncbi:MAG: PAC2 family protein [Candidatus Heimdallarchaeota archaeon]|nr:PAC2 family protein [Candidatus Heimdallarchaeota archaeon]
MEKNRGKILELPPSLRKDIKNFQVICGFAGFGNVGYLTLSHLIETMNPQSFAFWGNHAYYYQGNLESTLTAYVHYESKSIFITTRLPIFVSNMPKHFWDTMVADILSWEAKRYIIIGGLKEDTRLPQSTEWAAFVPSPKWTEDYGHTRSFAEKLSMIGPLASLLMMGTTKEMRVLGLLAYCNSEEDVEAALFTLSQVEVLANIPIPKKDELAIFDYSFLSGDISADDDDFDEHEEGYDDFDIQDLT